MKLCHLLVLISIFALCGSFSGCAHTDEAPQTTGAGGNKQAVIVNTNANQAAGTQAKTLPTVSTGTAVVNSAQPNASSPQPPTKTDSPKTTNDSQVTMASFDQIKPGMSYKEVVKILGSSGSTTGAMKTQNGSMAMYSWKGKSENGEWNVTARFDNGKLVNKVQFGLK